MALYDLRVSYVFLLFIREVRGKESVRVKLLLLTSSGKRSEKGRVPLGICFNVGKLVWYVSCGSEHAACHTMYMPPMTSQLHYVGEIPWKSKLYILLCIYLMFGGGGKESWA